MSNKTQMSVGTHDGAFHADEVTALALLLLFGKIQKEKIHRTRDQEILNTCEYVCDVGGDYNPEKKLFDHHQVEYTGILSSAGMVLKFLKESNDISKELYKYFNGSLVMGVDAVDNGLVSQQHGHCSFSSLIAAFVPPDYSSSHEQMDEAFFSALEFTLGHLKRLVAKYEYIRSCKSEVEKSMKNAKECLFFDKPLPWIENFFDLGGETHPALFVIMPAGEHWKLRGVPPSYDQRMKVRKLLPAKWAGLLESDLKKASNIDGAIFCHKGRFISIWETKDDAVKALEYVLSQ